MTEHFGQGFVDGGDWVYACGRGGSPVDSDLDCQILCNACESCDAWMTDRFWFLTCYMASGVVEWEANAYRNGGSACKACKGVDMNVPELDRVYSSSAGYAQSMLDSVQAWSAASNTIGQWMQMDLGIEVWVAGVVTAGRYDCCDQWVSSYEVATSLDGSYWSSVDDGLEFTGNSDMHTKVLNFFQSQVKARYVRILASGWNNHISMRAAVIDDTGSTRTMVCPDHTGIGECGIVTAIDVGSCIPDADFLPCNETGYNEYCDGDGECGTDEFLDNCGEPDVYLKAAATMKCGVFPPYSSYGCSAGGGAFELLSSDADEQACIAACESQRGYEYSPACCLVGTYGCYVKPLSDIKAEAGDSGKAVMCYVQDECVFKGHGICGNGYYTGWDRTGLDSVNACIQLCQSEYGCTHISYCPPGEGDCGAGTCLRFQGLCSTLLFDDAFASHYTYHAENACVVVDSFSPTPRPPPTTAPTAPTPPPTPAPAVCEYDYTPYGAADCDVGWDLWSLTCQTLEDEYYWDCTGCACPGDVPAPTPAITPVCVYDCT
ncbi:unnamed protein product, partial [Prorocentrum cordatum]